MALPPTRISSEQYPELAPPLPTTTPQAIGATKSVSSRTCHKAPPLALRTSTISKPTATPTPTAAMIPSTKIQAIRPTKPVFSRTCHKTLPLALPLALPVALPTGATSKFMATPTPTAAVIASTKIRTPVTHPATPRGSPNLQYRFQLTLRVMLLRYLSSHYSL